MKRAVTVFLAAASVLAATGFGLADEAYDSCVRADAADVEQCGEAWLQREQAGLDIGWQAMLAQTDGSVREALAAEQKAWAAFYGKSCDFMRDPVFSPGGDHTSFYACRAGVLADREREIAGYTSYVDN